MKVMKRKAIFGVHDKRSYAVNIDVLSTNNFFRQPFGRQLDDRRRINEWKNSAEIAFVNTKHKDTIVSVRAWVKEQKPTEFYAEWSSDSRMWKDDTVQIFYKR